MAERYYSNIHPDESSKVYMNYNVMQAPAPAPAPHINSLAGMTTQMNNDYDYLTNTAAFYTTVATSNSGGMAVVDMNNNRSTSRYYNIGSNNGKQNIVCGVGSGNSQSGHIYTNKVLPSSLMTKYTSAGSYMHGGGGGTMMSTHVPSNDTNSHHFQSTLPQGQYGNHNNINSYGGYQRNRYMPYNRSTTPSTLHHNAMHSTTAITTCGPLTSASAISNAGYHQFAAPVYQTTCTPGGIMQTFASAAPLTAVSVQQQQQHTSLHPHPMTSTICNPGGQEFTFAHAVSASLTPSTTVTATVSNNGDSKNSMSLATATATSSGGTTTSGNTVMVSTPYSSGQSFSTVSDPNDTVTLQITNLDYSMDEVSLRNFLLNQLKPITPVVSLTFEGSSYAKVTVPDLYFAKQVVSNLHRKKIGHKRMLVSYTRDSSLTEINTLRCQVAGLLKDVPCYTLPMYKFRELFQSRFKTSISVLDLYKMQDICIINSDNNEEKFISLHPDLVNSLESSPLMEGLQHSVPYCTIHFKREQHKGWAEQEIEPLPNVFMTISEIQQIIHPLLKNHTGDIPVASLVHCIEGQLKIQITPNDNGVNLEHLVCCVQGIQITVNNFGIKILGWLELNKDNNGQALNSNSERSNLYSKNSISDPLYQISREVIELVKMSPKATMKFNRFIPAYHNHFGKQCRVADYGYTKLIELFEALSSVVQIMGDGENRQITLTHRTQIRRFTSDLLRVLRAHGNKSVLLSQLPNIFAQTQNRTFDVTDYGVCDIVDILDGLVNSNIVVVSTVQNGKDILISIPKRKQTTNELEKTCIFAGEIVELFSNAPQYTILFQKFVRSYHYHFGYQCRLSDYGFQKLADLMEAVHGVVEMELTNDEDKKIYLTSKVARRIFAEQCEELITATTGSGKTCMKWEDVVKLHKKKYGYQIQAQTLGVKDMKQALDLLPYVETFEKEDSTWMMCHKGDNVFRTLCYRASKYLLSHEAEMIEQKDSKDHEIFKNLLTLNDFIKNFNEKYKETITEATVKAMKHAIEIVVENGGTFVRISGLMHFLMNIIRLLEQRAPMLLLEIKNALDCTISTTFEFGYPNLYTVISTHSDIFYINLGVTLERSEVGLVGNTELRLTSYANHKHLFGSLKLPYSKQKTLRASTRPPLGENNGRCNTSNPNQEPPAKTRAMSSDSSYNSSSNYRSHNPASYYQQTSKASTTSASYCPKTYSTGGNSFNNISSSSSIYSTASQNSHIMNTSVSNMSSNKENSFNSSFMFNNSFNTSSNTSGSYCELNASMNSLVNPMGCLPQPPPPLHIANSMHLNAPVPSVYPTSKLWDRRHGNNYYPQQQQPLLNSTNLTGTVLTPLIMPPPQPTQTLTIPNQSSIGPVTAEASAGLYELVNNIQMCPILYEPPKPDTPPSENMPFWIDPIWTNNNSNEKSKDDLLNIRLPELKALNVLPMLLSPYSISKTENMKQVFNFDSHDRKIA
ncbi:meiosis regulator and mRNA stability factor 1 [Musca domestica]|uniref:Meiosis arrest female protein 1 n=1 Tax=Musca domestica TaxID=7370 RepID=A0A1I8N7L0_MUSDO|nr:meiosis regulator and mRNA stability factor 1 [Musca domestica]XP_058981217.1 meiosis regulator and mRNA stability factor 1 [Musca domestica]